jgi:hypothetical protein
MNSIYNHLFCVSNSYYFPFFAKLTLQKQRSLALSWDSKSELPKENNDRKVKSPITCDSAIVRSIFVLHAQQCDLVTTMFLSCNLQLISHHARSRNTKFCKRHCFVDIPTWASTNDRGQKGVNECHFRLNTTGRYVKYQNNPSLFL